jgi:hypothetical protein
VTAGETVALKLNGNISDNSEHAPVVGAPAPLDPQTRAQRPAPPRPAPARDTFFTSALPAAELRNKQAVLETSEGTIVLDLLADAAPNHVAHFITGRGKGRTTGRSSIV